MPGRSFSSSGYRYGFNGQEKDDEVKGAGNSIDFGARIHDPRLGRLLSIDPLSRKFPSESNYSYAGNSPLLFVDQEGEKKTIYFYVIDNDGKVSKHTVVNERDVRLKSYSAYGGDVKFYSADVEQTIIIDMKNHSMQIGEEQFKISKQNYFAQKLKNVKDGVLDDLGISDGVQKFGFNVYSSEGVNSPAFEEIKGRAEIVENLDISGMVIPSLPDRGIGEAIEKLGEVNKDVKVVADIFSKSVEFATQTIETVEKAAEVSKSNADTSDKTDSCTVCQKTGSPHELKKDGYHGKTVKRQ